MSDPKAMTLEEAVNLCSELDRQSGHPDFLLSDDEYARWDRARAIVDAAVEFIKARAEVDAASDTEPVGNDERMALAFEAQNVAEAKLRALERGESEGKP